MREIRQRFKFPAYLILAIAFAAVAREQGDSNSSATKPSTESAILVEEMKRLLARPDLREALSKTQGLQSAKAQPATQEAQKNIDICNVIELVRANAPEVFNATPDEQECFARREYTEKSASEKINVAIDTFGTFRATLPPVTFRLIDLYRDSKLSGIELELTSRIFDVHLRELINSVSPSKKPERKALPI